MPPNTDKMMLSLGKFYELLCKIPLIGYPFARFYNRMMGRILFYMPGSDAKRADSIDGIRQYLLKTKEDMGFPFVMIPESDTEDSLDFFVDGCPYGYTRSDQEKACDAAMQMDHILFKLQGGDLTILEKVMDGPDKCRMHIKMRK
ncbi:MAG: hypothetical protein HN737_02665 [Desulfobacterales bacterium]|jgi:hypothetical protein|nr:hypothetical protein [Desulfobacula sp.]MBT4362976.1 hypothetical protein [Desulfobacteraceae bacterium]MBT7696294.1 hypothetical protein [Desulfobacterales bacterium]